MVATAQIIPLRRSVAPFTQQVLRCNGVPREGVVVGTFVYERPLLSLLQAQLCGENYIWKGEAMYCAITFLNCTGWAMCLVPICHKTPWMATTSHSIKICIFSNYFSLMESRIDSSDWHFANTPEVQSTAINLLEASDVWNQCCRATRRKKNIQPTSRVLWRTRAVPSVSCDPVVLGRNEGERGHSAPGSESLGGAEKSQQRPKYFICIYSQKTLGSNMGAPYLFLAPGAIQRQYAPAVTNVGCDAKTMTYFWILTTVSTR